MPTIHVDDAVFAEIKRIGVPAIDTPNMVLRRVLKLEREAFITPDLFRYIIRKEKEEQDFIERKTDARAPLPDLPNYEDPVVSYKHPRLCFKAALIEPLNDDDVFEICTANDGNYRFSKRDFYLLFPNVTNSMSYKENGIYIYPKVPKKAGPFDMEWEEQHAFAQKLIERAK